MEWGRSGEGDRVRGGEPSDQPGHEPGHHGNGEPASGSGRVLVCDDTEQIRRLIRVNLEFEGYEVVEAVDGQAGLELLGDLSQPLPDVITVDAVMPRRDGWSMVSCIRADPRLAHIPIVMVTASAQERDRAQALVAAVDEFVAKPFDPEVLVAMVGVLAGSSHG